MKELLVMIADVIPFEKIAEDLRDATNAYILNPSQENKKAISVHAMLFNTKIAIEDKGGDSMGMIKEMYRFEALSKMANLNKS